MDMIGHDDILENLQMGAEIRKIKNLLLYDEPERRFRDDRLSRGAADSGEKLAIRGFRDSDMIDAPASIVMLWLSAHTGKGFRVNFCAASGFALTDTLADSLTRRQPHSPQAALR